MREGNRRAWLLLLRQREHVERVAGRGMVNLGRDQRRHLRAGCRRRRRSAPRRYCRPPTLNVIGKPCTDVASRVRHSTLPVATSTALNSRSRSPTNATPPRVDSTAVRNGARCWTDHSSLSVARVVGRELADVAVRARHLVEAPVRARAAAAFDLLDVRRAHLDAALRERDDQPAASAGCSSSPASCGRPRCSGTRAIHSPFLHRDDVGAVVRLARSRDRSCPRRSGTRSRDARGTCRSCGRASRGHRACRS